MLPPVPVPVLVLAIAPLIWMVEPDDTTLTLPPLALPLVPFAVIGPPTVIALLALSETLPPLPEPFVVVIEPTFTMLPLLACSVTPPPAVVILAGELPAPCKSIPTAEPPATIETLAPADPVIFILPLVLVALFRARVVVPLDWIARLPPLLVMPPPFVVMLTVPPVAVIDPAPVPITSVLFAPCVVRETLVAVIGPASCRLPLVSFRAKLPLAELVPVNVVAPV